MRKQQGLQASTEKEAAGLQGSLTPPHPIPQCFHLFSGLPLT